MAVYSEADAEALFVREADRAVAIGGPAPADSYLRADAVVQAALDAGADAVHPGYGFLAENAAFARAVSDAGLTWIGPAPEAIEAMGSKTEARDRMEKAGVPVLPGQRLDGEAGDALSAVAEAIGYPLLVKASAGGGGKGMRLVESAGELESGVEGARREAAGAFGDDTVFLERFAPRSRHVEIQIIGDMEGTVAALGERDCSVQRRHQKVIEESPSPAVDEALRTQMSEAAVAAGQALGYVGAGTVEFLLTEQGEFFFLEVNTRLQVEHPVTELVTGLDLVELQIAVAEGRPLPAEAIQPELSRPRGGGAPVRRGRGQRLPAGHRHAEPLPGPGRACGWTPAWRTAPRSAPTTTRWWPRWSPTAPPAPMPCACWPTRWRAPSCTAPPPTATSWSAVLRHEEFGAGRRRHVVPGPPRPGGAGRLAARRARAAPGRRRRGAGAPGRAPRGGHGAGQRAQRLAQRPGRAARGHVRRRRPRAGGGLRCSTAQNRLTTLLVDGEEIEGAVLHDAAPDHVDLEAGGHRRRFSVHAEPSGAIHVNCDAGQLSLVEQPRHPQIEDVAAAGSLASPMPGSVWKVLAAAGDDVTKGQPLLIIEAMKMEHEIVAPVDGPLEEMRVAEGDQVDAGTILAVIGEAGGDG